MMMSRHPTLLPVLLGLSVVLGAGAIGWLSSSSSMALTTPTTAAAIAPPAPDTGRTTRLIELAAANVSATQLVAARPRSDQAMPGEDISLFEALPADLAETFDSVAIRSDEPAAAPAIVLALADPQDIVASDVAALPAADGGDTGAAKTKPAPIEITEECLVVEPCIDRYLWALYQRTPKEDTGKESERRKVAVKRKGKLVMVTRTFTRLVEQDFTWKDPKAAERAGLSMQDYVIGGMDRSFKLKLFHLLQAAEAAGLSPGITSAFRDDYRQSIASGLKAASNRSFHGGSLRGGYGHGLAADVVSVDGRNRAQRWVSTEKLWKWIDGNGKAYGIGRPYLDRDPPHIGPIDGQEYASRRGGAKAAQSAAEAKKPKQVTAREHRAPGKPARAAGLAKNKAT